MAPVLESEVVSRTVEFWRVKMEHVAVVIFFAKLQKERKKEKKDKKEKKEKVCITFINIVC